MNDNPKIVSVRITPMPKKFTDPMPEVWARFAGESEERMLFKFFPDEISFSPEELVGLTEAEAHAVYYKKDRAYMAS